MALQASSAVKVSLEKLIEGRWQVRLNGLRAGLIEGGGKNFLAENLHGSVLGRRLKRAQAIELIKSDAETRYGQNSVHSI